jgi:hypothetical protein
MDLEVMSLILIELINIYFNIYIKKPFSSKVRLKRKYNTFMSK